MPTIGSLTTLAAGKAYRSEVNGNFTTIRTAVNTYAAFQDATATVTAAWTFSTSPVFPAAVTFALGATITAGGLVVTAGASTFGAGVTIATGGLAVTAGASTFGAAVTITGTCTATTFSGSGASLTSLPAANLTGTIAAISGANVTTLNGSNISSGTVADARLPTTLGGKTFSAATRVDGALTVGTNGAIDFEAASPVETIAFNFNQYQAVAGSNTPNAFDNTCPVATQTDWKWIKVTVDGGTGWFPVCME